MLLDSTKVLPLNKTVIHFPLENKSNLLLNYCSAIRLEIQTFLIWSVSVPQKIIQ